MKFELGFTRVYPHPPAKVWRALTDPAALGQWLMETDFEPQPYCSFRMWCDNGAGGRDSYLCKVLEYDPPRRMLWSWVLDGAQSLGDTFVEFRVEPVAGGTRVTISHSGDRDAETVEKFKSGWPWKLEQLAELLSGGPRVG